MEIKILTHDFKKVFFLVAKSKNKDENMRLKFLTVPKSKVTFKSPIAGHRKELSLVKGMTT